MNAMLEPSTQAANTHACRRLADGSALAVERMISSSQGRLLGTAGYLLAAAGLGHPRCLSIAGDVRQQNIH
jgi:hypothetical protein